MTFNDAMSPYFSTFGLCQPISTLSRCGSVFYFLITSNVTVHLKHGSLIALPWLVPFLFFDLNKCKTWSLLNVYVYQFFCSSELAWTRTSGSVPRTGRRTSEGSQRSANSLQTQVQDGSQLCISLLLVHARYLTWTIAKSINFEPSVGEKTPSI